MEFFFNLKMDHIEMEIEIKFMLFCMSEDLVECLDVLKEKLKKSNQIKNLDFIYDSFIKTITLEEFNKNSIIPGLDKVVKLIVFSQYYKKLLFPKKEHKVMSRDIITYLKDTLLIKNFTYAEFISIIQELVDLGSHRNFGEDVNAFCNSHFCFPYVLIHKAGNLSFENLAENLFGDEKYSKLPLGFKLFDEIESPHNNYYITPYLFLLHDFIHYKNTISNIELTDLSIVHDRLKTMVKGSFKRRINEIYLITKIFERQSSSIFLYEECRIEYRKFEPFCDFDKFDTFMINNFDNIDIFYVFSYIFNSFDIELYINNFEEFTCDYMDYKIKIKILKELKMKSGAFKIEDFTEYLDIKPDSDINLLIVRKIKSIDESMLSYIMKAKLKF